MANALCLFKVSLQRLGSFCLDKALVPVYTIATAADMQAPLRLSQVLSNFSSCGNMSELGACTPPACQTLADWRSQIPAALSAGLLLQLLQRRRQVFQ